MFVSRFVQLACDDAEIVLQLAPVYWFWFVTIMIRLKESTQLTTTKTNRKICYKNILLSAIDAGKLYWYKADST